MKGLCRDCNIHPSEGDNICINKLLLCQYITKNDIERKIKGKLNAYSFYPVNNCFLNLSFGGDKRGIYGGTPTEILHAIQLGLCEYISHAIDLMFSPTSVSNISCVIAGIYRHNRCQIERDLPDLRAFRNGLTSVAKLKVAELFLLYMCYYWLCPIHFWSRIYVPRKGKEVKAVMMHH